MTGMDDTLLYLLRQPEPTTLWAAAQPAWLWHRGDRRIAWANAAAIALWRADNLATLTRRDSSGAQQPAFAQMDRLAFRLAFDMTQLERLRFFSNGRDINLLCLCAWRRYGNERFILVTAMQPVANLVMPVDAAGHADRLLAGMDGEVALLSSSGQLLKAGADWQALIPAIDSDLERQFAALARRAETGAHSGQIDIGEQSRRAATSIVPIGARERLILVSLSLPQADAQSDNVEELIGKLQRDHLARQVRTIEYAKTAKTQPDDNASEPGNETTSAAAEPVGPASDDDREDARTGSDTPDPPDEPDANTSPPTSAAATVLPAVDVARPRPAVGGPNVFRIGGAAVRPIDGQARLQSSEHAAFRELAKALGARLESDMDHAPPVESDEPVQPPHTPTDPPIGREAARDTLAPMAHAAELIGIIERLPVALLVFTDGQPVFANRALLDMFRFASLPDLLALPGVSSLLPQIDGESPHRPARLLARRRDGETFHVIARLKAVAWNGQKAMLLSMRDVAHESADDAAPAPVPMLTPHATTQAGQTQLRQQVMELAAAVSLAADAVIMLDAKRLITSVHECGGGLLGGAAAGLVGHSFTDLFSAETRGQVTDYLDALDRHGVIRSHGGGRDVMLARRGAATVPVRLKLNVSGTGDTRRFCAVLQDISQWKATEQDLTRARIEAEQASNQKSEFLAMVSHEIRTPLNSIIGFSELMIEERFAGVENERYRSYMRDIHDSGRLLLGVVNDLLDLSKVESGKMELDFTSVDVNESVARAVTSMQPEARRGKIILRSSYAGGLPKVVADQRSLQQILLNLLSNAIKFTEAGGQVIVSTGLSESGAVQIRVRDTGSGMNEEQVQAALEPFRQIPRAQPTRVPGTGLGLPLTKALAEANRALFDIDSTPGVGTLAQIAFPTPRARNE